VLALSSWDAIWIGRRERVEPGLKRDPCTCDPRLTNLEVRIQPHDPKCNTVFYGAPSTA
jgi:hypothetical protein